MLWLLNSSTRYILNKLFNTNNEDEQAAMTELEGLLLSRISEANDSGVSSQTFQQITDSVLIAGKS